METKSELENVLFYLNLGESEIIDLHNFRGLVNGLPIQYQDKVDQVFTNFIFSYKSMKLPLGLFRTIYLRYVDTKHSVSFVSPTKTESTQASPTKNYDHQLEVSSHNPFASSDSIGKTRKEQVALQTPIVEIPLVNLMKGAKSAKCKNPVNQFKLQSYPNYGKLFHNTEALKAIRDKYHNRLME